MYLMNYINFIYIAAVFISIFFISVFITQFFESEDIKLSVIAGMLFVIEYL